MVRYIVKMKQIPAGFPAGIKLYCERCYVSQRLSMSFCSTVVTGDRHRSYGPDVLKDLGNGRKD